MNATESQTRDPAQPGVVFVHGMRTSHLIWTDQIAVAEAAGYPAIAVDLPGHGARIEERFTMAGAFRVIDQAIRDLGRPARVALVGLSLGGYTSLGYAARRFRDQALAAVLSDPNFADPQYNYPQYSLAVPGDREFRSATTTQIAGVIAAGCSSDPKGKPVAAFKDVAAATVFGAHALQRGAHTLTSAIHRGLTGAASPPGGADLAALVGPATATASASGAPRPSWHLVTDALGQLAGHSSLADLREIAAPVWLVNGERDPLRLEEHRCLAAAQEGALVVVPNAGHDVNTDAPEPFNTVMLRALSDFTRL